MNNRYVKSESLLERALKVIPLGSQTFSKSLTQFPYGVSPYFITKGMGSHVWDVDGNEYVDMISSLCSVTLGYNDPDVNLAVSEMLENGTIFSLPNPIELEVAEKIVEMVPCAEMVRFGKNGSDATAGAVRVARAYTKKDHVLVCGYHGWQDWYIGSTARNLGVPEATRNLTHSFKFNDIDSLNSLFNEYNGNVAAVIMEPMNATLPEKSFLQEVKELAHKNNSLFILDETITGFRYANGGAQELFGVIPDLATFGKGLANGYPVSVVAGKEEYMRIMEDVFFSFTFGGETLSLAAAKATMDKLTREPVVETIMATGSKVMNEVDKIIVKNSLSDIVSLSGHPSWSIFTFKDSEKCTLWEMKTLFMQEMMKRGILSFGSHNINYSHSESDLKKLFAAYEEVFASIRSAVVDGGIDDLLECRPLEPLFKVR